ncbi:MAG: rhodanese-like domain-containing protein [Methyloprofundus sp.]|nr:rhodanese-like domain-containing protein [Methyloprofundus sp.]
MLKKLLFKYIFIFAFIFTNQAVFAEELIDLTSAELSKLQENALVIDIRTPPEWKNTGIIPGSQPLRFFNDDGGYDLDAWLAEVKKLQKSPDQAIILICRSGYRSGRVGNLLVHKLKYSDVSHLSKGIYSWIQENHPTAKVCTATKTC